MGGWGKREVLGNFHKERMFVRENQPSCLMRRDSSTQSTGSDLAEYVDWLVPRLLPPCVRLRADVDVVAL